MYLEKLKEDKEKLEKEILNLIVGMEEKYNIYFEDIHLITEIDRRLDGKKISRTVEVISEIKI